MSDARAAQLLSWARAGSTVVVEDAPRVARGSLAEALGMRRGQASASGLTGVVAVQPHHPALVGVPLATWRLPPPTGGWLPPDGGGADVILRSADGWAVVWTRPCGKGKLVGIAAQRRQWRRPLQAIGYDTMVSSILAMAAREPASRRAEIAGRGAFRAWMYLGFPAGQAMYRLHAQVPDDYALARSRALDAWRLAKSRPTAAIRLVREATAGAERLAVWGARYWRTVPDDTLRMVAGRPDLILCPGTLDFEHATDLSTGASFPGQVRPASGLGLCPDGSVDNPVGAVSSQWRGIRPFLALAAELPLSINPGFRQETADGTPVYGAGCARWLSPMVRSLLADSVPDVQGPTLVLYAQGRPDATASCAPGGDYSPAAREAYAALCRKAGLTAGVPSSRGHATGGAGDKSEARAARFAPPAAWEPSERWLLWEKTQALGARARWERLASAVHRSSPRAALAVDAGYLGDPEYAGLAPETGAQYVDCLAPLVLADYPAGFDPADLVAQLRWVAGMASHGGLGDRGVPAFVGRFRWQDAMALSPAANALVSAVALACGSGGVWETWASSPGEPDLAASDPEDVYVRWEAAFAPALRARRLLLEATPAVDLAIWRSWDDAAMARPDAAERAAALRGQHWADVLARAGFMPGFLDDSQVTALAQGGVSALVVPSVECVSKGDGAALERYVRRGGVLVIGPGSFAFDEYHRPRALPGWLAAGLSGRAGSATAAAVALRPAAATCAPAKRAKAPSQKPSKSLPLAAGALGSSLLRPTRGARVVLKSAAGAPVAWDWRCGRGRVLYLAAEPAADQAWADWLAGYLAGCGVRAAVRCSAGARGAAMRLKDGRRLVLVYNAGPVGRQKAVAKVSVSLAAGLAGTAGTVRELVPVGLAREGAFAPKAVATGVKGGALVFQTSLAPNQYRLYIVSPKE